MKKLALAFMFLLAFSTSGFADAVSNADLEDYIEDFELSNNVEGEYSSNATNSEYSVSTAHTQGNMVYGSGSFVSAIFEKDIAGDEYASSDLDAVTTFDSSGFDSDWSAR